MKRFVAFILCLWMVSGVPVCATETDRLQSKTLLDVACDSSYPYIYERLQEEIDTYLLPGYVVEGKKVFWYGDRFDWFSTSGDSWPRYAGGYFIFEDNVYYQLEDEPLKIILQENTSEIWKTVLNFLQEDHCVEIDGATRKIVSVKCASTTGILLYLRAKDGSTYVRHYDPHYGEVSDTGAIPYRDYLEEEFNQYRSRYCAWLNRNFLRADDLAEEGNSFAEYMVAGAPEPSAYPVSTDYYVQPWYLKLYFQWYVLAGMIVVAGGITVIVLVRRRKKRKTKI